MPALKKLQQTTSVRTPDHTGLQTKMRNRLIAQAKIKPLELMLEVMAERYEAAKAAKNPKTRAKAIQDAVSTAEKAAPYVHAKLQATTLKGDAQNPIGFVLSLPASDTLKAAIRGKTEDKA
jgi:hypothetical protein